MNEIVEPAKQEKSDFFQQLVLGEVSGKNAAIHAYDGMIWKIRTGFLTLLFVGWAVLLKSMAEHPEQGASTYRTLVMGMFLFSLGVAIGAWFVDSTYVRRKHRVILALNGLMDTMRSSPNDLASAPQELLRVAGDNPEMPHRSKGYSEAMRDGICVFFVPLLTLAAAAYVILPQRGIDSSARPSIASASSNTPAVSRADGVTDTSNGRKP